MARTNKYIIFDTYTRGRGGDEFFANVKYAISSEDAVFYYAKNSRFSKNLCGIKYTVGEVERDGRRGQ